MEAGDPPPRQDQGDTGDDRRQDGQDQGELTDLTQGQVEPGRAVLPPRGQGRPAGPGALQLHGHHQGGQRPGSRDDGPGARRGRTGDEHQDQGRGGGGAHDPAPGGRGAGAGPAHRGAGQQEQEQGQARQRQAQGTLPAGGGTPGPAQGQAPQARGGAHHRAGAQGGGGVTGGGGQVEGHRGQDHEEPAQDDGLHPAAGSQEPVRGPPGTAPPGLAQGAQGAHTASWWRPAGAAVPGWRER